jgi:hypothetical protein
LLYHSVAPREEQFLFEGMVTIDPETGAVSTDFHTNETPDASFLAPSPDGRYWLRPDLNVLPVQDISDSRQRFMPWGQKQRYYGVTLQLWETDPLRFVRRIVVAWLQADELPNEAHCTLPERQAIWNAIHTSTQNANVGPLGGMQRTHFSNVIRDDDEAWRKIDSNRMELARWYATQAGNLTDKHFGLKPMVFCRASASTARFHRDSTRSGGAYATTLGCRVLTVLRQ